MRNTLLILALCLLAGGAVVMFNWNRVGRPEPASPITCTNCHEVIVVHERSGMLVHAETRSVTCAPYIERMHELRQLASEEMSRPGHPSSKRVSAAEVLRILNGERDA